MYLGFWGFFFQKKNSFLKNFPKITMYLIVRFLYLYMHNPTSWTSNLYTIAKEYLIISKQLINN